MHLSLIGITHAKMQQLCEGLANWLSANLMHMRFQNFKVLNIYNKEAMINLKNLFSEMKFL